MAKKRGQYPALIETFVAEVGDAGATSEEIGSFVSVHLPEGMEYSEWSLRAALNRMSRDYAREEDRRAYRVLDKVFEYKPVGANRFGTRVYRYKLAAGYSPVRKVNPDEDMGSDLTEIENRANEKAGE